MADVKVDAFWDALDHPAKLEEAIKVGPLLVLGQGGLKKDNGKTTLHISYCTIVALPTVWAWLANI